MTKQAALWSKTLRLGDQSLDLETGRIARQADGALVLRRGRTVMLVTATSRSEPSRHLGFFPLTVEYREKMAGAGRIPGGFLRREGRLGAHEVLGSRLVDRSIRPHFPEGFRCETQVLASVLSFDPLSDPEVLAITGASAALHVSEIPWKGPVAGVRVVRVAGEIRAFPSFEERQAADLDLLVSFSAQGLVMMEGNASEVPEEILLTALEAARQAADPLLEAQEELRRAAGTPKREFAPPRAEPELVEKIRALLLPGVDELFGPQEKRARGRLKDDLLRSVEEALAAEEADAATEGERGQQDGDPATRPPLGSDETAPPPLSAREIAEDVLRQEIRRRALKGQRLDGRGPEEIRAISGEVAWLPGAHGSSVFTRGETQALVTCTLGSERDEQLIEDLHGLHKERFLLHYNFPPYSVGEVRPLRVPGRREIGHGQLARRAIRPVLPESEEFPYTIRVESEIASSNGSSSMATVCGATLAMMDAGVTLRRPVAGIAMGLITDGEQSVILSDILGDEDHLGDMDFKVAGTGRGPPG
jgi:polyribonucleotide nucleotidyltransferase